MFADLVVHLIRYSQEQYVMSITCSRCQAENNDIKHACWNCWAVLPRLLSDDNILDKTVKLKTDSSEEPESSVNIESDVTTIAPPEQEPKKKASLFGGFGKKKVIEPEPEIEEQTDLFADMIDEKEEITTAAAAAFLDENKVETTNEDIFAPIEENINDEELTTIPEPAKEKKGLFGFGAKKTPAPEVQITSDTTDALTDITIEETPAPKEKKSLFGFGRKKTEILPAEDISDAEIPSFVPAFPIEQPVAVEPIINLNTNQIDEGKSTSVSDESTIPISEPLNIVIPEFSGIKSDAVESEIELTAPDTSSSNPVNNSVIDAPFEFDFKAEVEKVFGGTDHITEPDKPKDNTPGKVKRIRPKIDDDGGLIKIKRPK